MATSTHGSRNSTFQYNETTTAPGVSDDNTAGYSVGSRWWDTTADKEYVCLDTSTGAAVWTETTGGGGGTVSGSKSIAVEFPSSSEDITIFFTSVAITITEMRAVLLGSSTPSVTWTIRHHATDRSNAGNEVVTGGTTTTSTTSGSDVTSFNDATIPADSFVWLETTAQSGTVNEISITVVYDVD